MFWQKLHIREFLIITACVCGAPIAAQNDSLWNIYGHNVEWYNLEWINGGGLEFSPAFYGNGLVFCSTGRDKKVNLKRPIIELFYTELIQPGTPSTPQSFSPQINSPLNEGPSTFDAFGQHMYFTRNNSQGGVQKADKQDVVRMHVFSAEKGDYGWENIFALPFNADDYSCMHPALSSDGQKLYFASDMPGGFGGMDIYVAHRTESGWSKPENLGADVNSEADEAFPSLFRDQWLFFASEHSGGKGGFDVYLSDLKSLATVHPLPAPFNSEADDFGLILHPLATHGYLSSSREGGFGMDDIYYFKTPPKFWTTITASEAQLELTITDKQSKQALAGAEVVIETYVALQDEQRPRGYAINTVNSVLATQAQKTAENGELYLRMQRRLPHQIRIFKEGYQTLSFHLSLKRDTLIQIALEPQLCENVPIQISDQGRMPIEHVRVSLIDPNEQDLKRNIALSDDGKSSICLHPSRTYWLAVQAEGYSPQRLPVRLSQFAVNDTLAVLLSAVADQKEREVKEGAVFVLEQIYYDFNKSAIRQGAAVELDELSDIMRRYPSMRILLVSHTDARGERRYNKQLSELRSAAAKDYLVAQGVATDRIETEGLGESEPRNECVDGVNCTEEQHAFNRRTEVRVITFEAEEKVEFLYGQDLLNTAKQ